MYFMEKVGKPFSSTSAVIYCSSIRCHSVIHCVRIGVSFWGWRIIALYEPKSTGWRGSPEMNTRGGPQGSHFRRYLPTPEKSRKGAHRSERAWRKSTSMVSQEVKYSLGHGQVRVQWTKENLWTRVLLLLSHFVQGQSLRASLCGTSAHAQGRLMSAWAAAGGHILGLAFGGEHGLQLKGHQV